VTPIIKLDNYILREIGMLSRCIHSICDTKFKEFDLQKGQFIFLTRVCENPGINQIDLSNLLKVDKTTTTKAIQKLIDAGYIRKTRDELDKRMWHLYANEKGYEIYTLVIGEENRNIAACFANFTEGEKESVLLLVKKMRENIENDWKILKKL
jgi:DNA-binding MarR family transcriptional regulator